MGLQKKETTTLDLRIIEFLYVGEEKPTGQFLRISCPGCVCNSGIIDVSSTIGMVRSGESACEDKANEHSNAILPPIYS